MASPNAKNVPLPKENGWTNYPEVNNVTNYELNSNNEDVQDWRSKKIGTALNALEARLKADKEVGWRPRGISEAEKVARNLEAKAKAAAVVPSGLKRWRYKRSRQNRKNSRKTRKNRY